VVDFTNTIIIATSNLGSHTIIDNNKATGKDKKDKAALKAELMETLRGHFRPEFLNRIDDIIVFDALSAEQIKNIVRFQLEKVTQMLAGQDITITFSDALVEDLAARGYQPEYGARELRRLIKTDVENLLARKLLAGDLPGGSKIHLDFTQKDGITIHKK
jgi:ATP-dependent Clp protease ATP-binding subunit ClpC